MGAGASVETLEGDKFEEAKLTAIDGWGDEAKKAFDDQKDTDGFVTKAQLDTYLCGAAAAPSPDGADAAATRMQAVARGKLGREQAEERVAAHVEGQGGVFYAFNAFDADHSGGISVEEFQAVSRAVAVAVAPPRPPATH